MTSDDLDRMLDAVKADAPGVDPAFADRLESRLLAVHDTLVEASPSRPRARIWTRPLLVAACLVVFLAVFAWAAPSVDDPELVLETASDATVILPDGTEVDADAGLVLPDGTSVTAGDEAVVIGGVRIEPGTTVVIRDGRVRDDSSGATPDDTASPPRDEPNRPETTEPSPTTTTLGDAPRPTVAPVPPQPSPSTTKPPTTTTTRPTSTTSTTTTTRPTEPVALSLTATRGDRRAVVLDWSAYRGPDFERVVVVRTASSGDGPPARPQRPTDGQQVFTSKDPRSQTATDTVPLNATSVAYRVFVLDSRNRTVAISNVAPA